jgi:DNA-binding transcriptional MerR regulator
MTHLSVKTLRRYHESGLLEPAEIDPFSGYRYYRAGQIPVAQTIRRFRDLDMPVREIAELISTGDPDERGLLIGQHLQRLETQLEHTRTAVAALKRLLDPANTVEVSRRTTAEIVAASIAETVAAQDILSWYADAMAEVDAALAAAGQSATGPPGGLYDNALFTDERGRLEVYVPVREPPRSGRVEPLVIPSTDLACAVHRGAHTDIDVTYGALGVWVNQHELTIAGPVHETYLVGPRDTPTEHQWRTEIGWPIAPA